MKKKILSILFIFLSVSLSGETKFIINNGQYSSIVDIKYDASRDLIFSAEESGSIAIWNLSDRALINHFQISSHTIDKILISPIDSIITVLSHNTEKYYLSIWDWNGEKYIASRIIEEEPLFLEYSINGKYLFYGNIGNPSLTFLDAKTRSQLHQMDRLPSIYDFADLSASEKTLMTYSSSGTISYYDFRTSENKKQVSTIPLLKNLNVIRSNNHFLTAQSGDDVYLIDRLKGTVEDVLNFNQLRKFYQNRENGHALTVERSNRNSILKKWSTNNNFFEEMEAPISLPTTMTITSMIDADGTTIVGDSSGTLYEVNWQESKMEIFATDDTKEISDLTISKGSLILSTENGLLAIETPFFDDKLSTDSELNFSKFENPLKGQVGIIELDNRELLLWNKSAQRDSIMIINSFDGSTLFEYSDFSEPIKDITYENRKIVTLEANGTIKIIDIAEIKEIFTYTAIGLQSVAMVDQSTLFAGRSSTAGKSPAITININTRETLTIDDDRFLIFDSIAVEKNSQLYTLGLYRDDNKTKTILKSHRYNELSNMRTLVIHPGEDMNAQVLIDPNRNNVIYAKIGKAGIYRINGSKYIKYTNKKPVKKIYLHSSILYALNQDNSITLFKAFTGKVLYSIHLFKDDSWALIPSSGDVYFGSTGIEEKIISYRNKRRVYIRPVNH